MKCIKCGQEMYSVTSGDSYTVCGNYVKTKYVCPKCGYEVSENFNDLVYRAPLFQPDVAKINYGWICPKCGAVLSPSTKECPYCTPYTVTCGPIASTTCGPIASTTCGPIASTTCGPIASTKDNITATIKGDLRAKEDMKEKGNEMY